MQQGKKTVAPKICNKRVGLVFVWKGCGPPECDLDGLDITEIEEIMTAMDAVLDERESLAALAAAESQAPITTE